MTLDGMTRVNAWSATTDPNGFYGPYYGSDAYFATGADTAPGITTYSAQIAFTNASGSISGNAPDEGVTHTIDHDGAFVRYMDYRGTYNGLSNDKTNGIIYLDALDTLGYVDLYIWMYAADYDAGIYDLQLISGDENSYQAILRIEADGEVILNPEITDPCEGIGDDDADTICNDADNCPQTANAGQADWNGDGQGDACDDSDEDGTVDADDLCREDPDKIAPGVCGCGESEEDSDDDGVPDCNDVCPSQADDGDGDGLIDCTNDPDDDNDGLDDACEAQWGLNPLVAEVTDGDLDGDGFSDYQECNGDANPNDAADTPESPAMDAVNGYQVVNDTRGDALAACAEANAIPTCFDIDEEVVVELEAAAVAVQPAIDRPERPIEKYTWNLSYSGDGEIGYTTVDPPLGSIIRITAPGLGRNETGTLTLSVTAVDALDIASMETQVAINIFGSAANSIPGVPSINTPADDEPVGADFVTTPILMVNAAMDDDDDPLQYEFILARDADLTEVVIQVLLGTAGITQLNLAEEEVALAENTFYYWSARACDATDCGAWMANSAEIAPRFFVNSENDPPSVPVIIGPDGGKGNPPVTVDTATPTLTVENAVDPDYYDTLLYYYFEIYDADPEDPEVDAGAHIIVDMDAPQPQTLPGESTAWSGIPADTLNEDSEYWWRARACDCDAAADETDQCNTAVNCSDWSLSAHFFVNTENMLPQGMTMVYPPAPIEGEPVPEVAETVVTLRVTPAEDAEMQVLSYRFQVDSNAGFSNPITSDIQPEDGAEYVEWPVGGLVENTLYYWRVIVLEDDVPSASEVNGAFRMNSVNEAPPFPVPTRPPTPR